MTQRLSRALRELLHWISHRYSKLSFPLGQNYERKDKAYCGNDSYSAESPLWRPYYLGQRVLGIFTIVFLMLAISFEVLLHVSEKDHGLATSSFNLHYLWTYGPTAILTFIASFWTRVEYQAKMTAPWCRMLKRSNSSQQSVLLDYVSQFQPMVIYAAIKNKDYSVAAATVVSLLLKLVIVLSTSFIVLKPTQILKTNVNATLTHQFVDNPSGLSTLGALPYSTLEALIKDNIPLPDGVMTDRAYEYATTDIPNILELTTTVDGFFADIRCEPATVTPAGARLYGQFGYHVELAFSMKTDSCELAATCRCTYSHYVDNSTICNSLCLLPGTCHSPQINDDRRFGIIASAITVDIVIKTAGDSFTDNAWNGNFTILRANPFICTPDYDIQSVKTIQKTTETQVLKIPDTMPRKLSTVHPWDIMQTYLDGISDNNFERTPKMDISFDKYFGLALNYTNYMHFNFLPTLSSLFVGDNIVQLFSSYYRQYASVLARVSLTKLASIPVNGSALIFEERLIVQATIAHLMTGVLAFTTVLVNIIWWKKDTLRLPQKPNTIIGNAVLLTHNPFSSLNGIGSASEKDLEAIFDCWDYRINDEASIVPIPNQQESLGVHHQHPIHRVPDVKKTTTTVSTFKPISLSAVSRSSAFILIIVVIITLEALLRISNRDHGIVDLPAEKSQYSLWTVVPGLLSAITGMYAASMDFDTRIQSPLLRLRQGSSFDGLRLDLVDRHTSTLILHELWSRCFEALVSTFALALTSLLTIFSASLFYVALVPVESNVLLKPSNLIYYSDSVFDVFTENDPRFAVGTLTLLQNASYPASTFEDLVFPDLELVEDISSGGFSDRNSTLKVIVPAARPGFLNCRLYNTPELRASIEISETPDDNLSDVGIADLHIRVFPETNEFSDGSIEMSARVSKHGTTYFAGTCTTCTSLTWIWGSFTTQFLNHTRPHVSSLFGLGCNDTLQVIETTVHLDAQTMLVDPNSPPTPHYETAVQIASNESRSRGDFYEGLPPVSTSANNTVFDSFFTILNSSNRTIPISSLGDALEVSKVVDAIKYQHRIFVVQYLNQQWRYDSTANKTLLYDFSTYVPIGNETAIFNATAYDHTERTRIFQDATSTRILQSLFATTLVCLGINWFLMRNVREIPRSPTNIANWIALLADGNLDDFLPKNAAHMSLNDISRWYFGQDAVFYLGYRKPAGQEDEVLGIYVEKRNSPPDSTRPESA